MGKLLKEEIIRVEKLAGGILTGGSVPERVLPGGEPLQMKRIEGRLQGENPSAGDTLRGKQTAENTLGGNSAAGDLSGKNPPVEAPAGEVPVGSMYRMRIYSPHIATTARPGQFLNINCSGGLSAMLRRPVSICCVDRNGKTVDFAFQIRGIGTEYLARKKEGEFLDVMGPLGNPFETDFTVQACSKTGSDRDICKAGNPDPGKESGIREKTALRKKIAVVGGGIGIFPLLFLLKEMEDCERTAFLGFRNAGAIVLQEEFKEAADRLLICTDDGSAGIKGFVTGLLEESIMGKGATAGNGRKMNRDCDAGTGTEINTETGRPFDMVYACGPTPMLKKVSALCEAYGIPCQVSMEQRMGCGIGACLVCACKTRKEGKDGESRDTGENWEYSHVCKDGPVYWSRDVIWDE